MSTPKKFVDLLNKLIVDGHSLVANAHQGYVADKDALRRWSNEMILLNTIGREMLKPWRSRIVHNGVHTQVNYVQDPLSAMEAVKYAIDNGLLNSYRELVLAEEFASLYEQGVHLLEQGYFLAAAVIFRAVLEERLRELCIAHSCMPQKDRPAINDLSQALYKCETVSYDKAMMLHITAITAIANNAAHNVGEVPKDECERLKRGTLDFLLRYST
jgi:hypothetical protein